MRKTNWIAVVFLLLVPIVAWSQPGNPQIIQVSAAPSGSCPQGLPDQQVTSTGALYSCQNIIAGTGTWGLVGTATGVPVVLPNGSTATTQPNPYDTSTKVATDQFVNTLTILQMATTPLSNITGGTYSFNSACTGTQANLTTNNGAITNILVWIPIGSGCQAGDVITFNAGNYDALVLITGVNGSGQPTGGTILYGGTGYVNGTAIASTGANAIQFSFLLSGTLGSGATFVMPYGSYLTTSNQWFWANNTTGSFTTTVCQAGAAGANTCAGGGRKATLPQGTNNSCTALLNADGIANVDTVYNQCAVAITGGTESGVALTSDTIDNTPIGGTTPAAVKATTLTASNAAAMNGGATATALTVAGLANPVGACTGAPSGSGGTMGASSYNYAQIVGEDTAGNFTLPSTISAAVPTVGTTASIVWTCPAIANIVNYWFWVCTGSACTPANYFTGTNAQYTQTAPASGGTAGALPVANGTGISIGIGTPRVYTASIAIVANGTVAGGVTCAAGAGNVCWQVTLTNGTVTMTNASTSNGTGQALTIIVPNGASYLDVWGVRVIPTVQCVGVTSFAHVYIGNNESLSIYGDGMSGASSLVLTSAPGGTNEYDNHPTLGSKTNHSPDLVLVEAVPDGSHNANQLSACGYTVRLYMSSGS